MRRATRPALAWVLVPFVLLAGAAAVASTAAASAVLRDEFGLQPVGSGELRWLGFRVYRASLWTPEGRFEGFEPGKPVALSLDYQRSFSRDELLRITGLAWQRLGHPAPSERTAWLARLEQVWSDVRAGQNMTTVVIPGERTLFYDDRQLLGEIDAPGFGPAFLSIWLDPRTVVSGLRQQLLGANADAGAVRAD